MPTRANAIGRYADIAPELQDTLRRNGMQARIVGMDDGIRLAVQGHDSPLLTYPLSREHLMALTDGGTNSSNRKAYEAFAAIVGGDFRLPKDYVHARNANGRVVMGLHGYRIGEGEYGRTVSPFMDLWARRGLLGWTPRNQPGFHLNRYEGAPMVAGRPDGRIKPGELTNGAYGFYYKGGQAATPVAGRTVGTDGEDVLAELEKVFPQIQARPRSADRATPYSEAITSDVYFSADKWEAVLASHGIVIDKDARTLTVKSMAVNRDLVYDLREDEMVALTAGSVKDVTLQDRLDIVNGIIGGDYDGKVTMEILEGREPVCLPLTAAAVEDIRSQERSLHPEPVVSGMDAGLLMEQILLQEREDERRGIGRVHGEDLYGMESRQGWFREGAHGREVSVGEIKVEPVRGDDREQGRDMKYRMTAVINGEAVSHEITRRQYDKFMAVDDYHRMILFSKVFREVDMKDLPRERGVNVGAAILAALTVAGEMTRGPRMAPDLYMERHAGGHVYMKPGVDSPQDIASRAFEAGINAAEHGVGLWPVKAGIMSELTYDDYLQRLSVQDLLRDAGYVRYRRDGLRYPSYVRLDEHGVRVRGDKFIVTQEGRRCFQPPEQRTYNVISLIKSRPELFPEYSVGMNLDLLVNKVCSRLLNTPFEEKERGIREPERETKPFRIDDYEIQGFVVDDKEIRRSFYPYFRHRGIDLRTQIAFRGHFALASHESAERKGVEYRNLVFPLTVPGGNGAVVGFEERGRYRRDGGAPYKGKAAGSNASAGLWIASPSRTMLEDARRVFLFESAYDAMAFYQLRRDEDKGIGRAVFVSTGGNPTRGQMLGLIRTAPSAVFHLCFDNDEAGHRFVENFKAVVKEEKPYSDVAQAFKDTPGHIAVDHEKESALFKLPKEVQQKYFEVEEYSEDLRTGYLCDEDKEELRARIKDGYREFFKAVDGLIVRMERDLPAEGFKDFNDELLGKESSAKRAVGCDLDGDGTVETEESNEENHRYRR